MRKKTILWILLPCVPLILPLLASCKKSTKERTEHNEAIVWEQVTAFRTFTHPVVEERWDGSEEEMPIFWSHIDMLYPQTSSAKLRPVVDSIAKTLSQNLVAEEGMDQQGLPKDPEALLAGLLTAEVEGYNKDMDYYLQREEAVEGTYFPIFASISDVCDSLVYNDQGLVSIARIRQTYSGGATHGMDYTQMLNFDLETGEQITPTMLFVDPESVELVTLVQAMMMQHFDVKAPEELGNHGLYVYDVDELSLSSNFFFHPEGIVLYYNPYEIAIYALGSLEVMIPYSALQPFLSQEYQFLADLR